MSANAVNAPPSAAAAGIPNSADPDQVATFRSFFQTYNTISEYCFNHCVWDFGTRDLRNREDRCVMRCTSHYLQSTKEIGNAFTEGQAAVMGGAVNAVAAP